MSAYVSLIENYQSMPPDKLSSVIKSLEGQQVVKEHMLATIQQYLAAARKAQKNQKRAAKKERKE